MELVRKNIHMDRIKGQASTQITLEDDINILDSRPDAGKLIYGYVSGRRGAAGTGMYGGRYSF